MEQENVDLAPSTKRSKRLAVKSDPLRQASSVTV